VYGLVGTLVEPLREGEGVVLVEEDGVIRLDRELRLD
jgi:hypothetical protein